MKNYQLFLTTLPELPFSEIDVIQAVETLKASNPEYKVPEVYIFPNNYFVLEDAKSKNGLWYTAYLYDAKESSILHIAVRGTKTNTTLSFVSVNNGLKIGNWKEINHHFSYAENQELKNQFEPVYLNAIKRILNKN